MAYCTQALLIDRWSERMLIDLTDRGEVATGAIDADKVARAIADADAQIDGYLKGRYQLPLESTPALVASLSLSIAIYNLHGESVPEKIRKDYEDAVRTLRDIAKGAVRLDVAGAEPATSGSEGVTTNEPERPITADTMKGYI